MLKHMRRNTENETHVNPRNKQELKNVFWMSEISYQEYHMKKMQRSKNNFLIRGIPLPFSEKQTLDYFKEICSQFGVSFYEWRDLEYIERLSDDLIKVVLKHSYEIEAQNLNELTVHGYRIKVSIEFDENSYKIYLQKCLENEKRSKSIWSFKFQNDMWLVKLSRDSISRSIHCVEDLHNLLKKKHPSFGGNSKTLFQFTKNDVKIGTRLLVCRVLLFYYC